MGEAKRRREYRAAKIIARDVTTQQEVEVRRAGDPMKLQIAWLRRETAAVPCNGCRECCWHGGVDVYPETEPPENLAHLDLEVRDDGKHYLRKREDGACVHLGPDGCTVYQHRPRACRSYDCRFYALFNVLDKYDGGHTQPTWHFEPTSMEGRAFQAACQMMGTVEFLHRRKSGADCSAHDIAEAVIRNPKFSQIAESMLAFAKLPPEQQTQLLGFDPRTLTAEQMRDSFSKAFGNDDAAAFFVLREEKP